ncbi:ABC transporter permease subunit [Pusillimonas caeni]|uniref:ABC transporter permease n=1 Tax=Pusillimonas caeni TaxID=1348472 RepID=UPI000E5A0B08|nr:ABC transporter permease subunit [Pusillimonas caeni]TFL14131.1 ABC transporter permease subunit [Pusillimonas caeni]
MPIQASSPLSQILLGSLVPTVAIVGWEIMARLGALPPESFSMPSEIILAWIKAILNGQLIVQTMQTVASMLLALVIAICIGVTGGVLLGLSRSLEKISSLTIELLRPIPSVALIPLSLLIFGFGYRMSAFTAAFASVWPILIMTTDSIRSTDRTLKEVGALLQLSFLERTRRITLPAAAPGIMVGIRVAAGIAVVVVVTTEVVANPIGLGYGLTVAQQSLQAALVWATLIWLGLIGWLFNYSVASAERRWLSWYWEVRA